MSELIRVPDIGSGEGEVIELFVKVGDTVEADQSILTLESDKASMEIPAPKAGVGKSLKVIRRLVTLSRILEVRHQLPLVQIKLGKPRIPFRAQCHARQIQAIRLFQPLSIQLRTADQHQLIHALGLGPFLRPPGA